MVVCILCVCKESSRRLVWEFWTPWKKGGGKPPDMSGTSGTSEFGCPDVAYEGGSLWDYRRRRCDLCYISFNSL